jgi:phage terminase large subunit
MNSAQLLRARPELFGKLVLGADLWSTQRAILQAITKHRRVAVKACHASGKSFAIAIAVLWWIVAHRDGIAVTTAPTWVQVQKIIWGEIRRVMLLARARSQLVLPVPNQTELMLGPGNYALGLSTDDSTRFQGFHSGKVLIVLDEAPGVRGEIYEAVEGISAGGDVHVLALGNPVTAGGPFYEAFTSDRGRWKTFTIDAFDTPNLEGLSLEQLRSLPPDLPESHPFFTHAPRPYLTTRRYVYESFWKYGEASPFWQARVRGQFPEQAEDALISLRWLEAARDPKRLPNDEQTLYAGIDVAEAGNDETVCAVRTEGGRIVAMKSWRGNSRGPVIAFLNQFKDRLEEINFDRAGVGAYFADDFEHLGFRNVNGINVGEATRFPDRFRNTKAELYWALRERFQEGQISGLIDELATAQLASIRYEINPRGLVEIESKDEMRKRGVKSPDRAEAIMLAFADRTPGMLAYVRQKAQHQQAVEAAIRDGKPPPEDPWNADELIAAYNQVREEFERGIGGSTCPKCGGVLGSTTTTNTDGRRYHPECARGW